MMNSKKRKKKIIFRRIISLMLVVAMVSGLVPVPVIKDGKIGIDFFDVVPVKTVYAGAVSSDLTNYTAAYNYAVAYAADPASYENDTITIDFNNPDTASIASSFPGIGTEEHPFNGKIIVASVNGDNGGYSANMTLNATLFNYITDGVEIVTASNTPCTMYLAPGADIGTAPLFATHVVGSGTRGDGIDTNPAPVTWNFKIANGNARSSIIGTLEVGTDGNPYVDVTVDNYSSDIRGTGDLGLVCNTVSAGNLGISFTNLAGTTTYADASLISTTGGNVGGLVGSVSSGAKIIINSDISFSTIRQISTTSGYAGGIVGSCEGGYSLSSGFTYTDSTYGTIEGTVGTGGLFGYYETSIDTSFDLSNYTVTSKQGDSADPGQGFKASQSSGKTGGLIGELENSGSATTIVIDGNEADVSTASPGVEVSLLGQYGGGLIGYYKSATLDNTLTIQNVCCKSEGSMSVKYGGLIGSVQSEADCGAYVSVSNLSVFTTAHPMISAIQYKAKNSSSAGLIESLNNSFFDISGDIIIDTVNIGNDNGSVNAGILHTSTGGVVRISGNTNLSSMKVTGDNRGVIAVSRDNTLIYALGSGTDSGWKYIRPATGSEDDIYSWGQVIRYVSDSAAANAQTLEAADVVSASGHSVTLAAAVPAMTYSVDFAKTALNIKLNTSGSDFGALKFTSGSPNHSSTLLAGAMSLSADIDLSGSGLTGLTKDNGSNVAYTGTFSGNSHKIKLATGEAYGYVSDDSTTATITAGAANTMTGAIQGHSHNGLFAKLGASTVSDLTIDGCINTGGTNIGGLAAELNGASVTLTNVDTAYVSSSDMFTINTAGSTNVGFLIGSVSDGSPSTLSIGTGCLIKGRANVTKAGANIGMIGVVLDKNVSVTTEDITLAATIDYNAAGGGSIGGLIGSSASGGTGRTFNLNNIDIDGMTVNTANSSGGIDSPAGALLGGKWYDTTVFFKDSTHTGNSDKGVTVTSGTVTLTGSGNTYAGGLVAEATGYWQLNNVGINGMIVSGATDALGLLVMRGKNGKAGANGLYLEITSPSAYSIASSGLTLPSSVNVFDEIMAYSKSAVSDGSGYVPSEANGQAIISIHTTDIDGTPKLSMSSTDNSYQPKTTLGENHNPFARYYYNLDYLLKNASTAGEKLLLWSVYQYAATNVKNHSAIKTANTKNFNDYRNLPVVSENAAELAIDLSYLSYYPVDISSATLNQYTLTFHNEEMETAHGGKYSTRDLKDSKTSQHYLMHAGLFKNVSGTLNISNMNLNGTVSAHTASNGVAEGSGAIVCGKIEGTSSSKATVKFDGITLNGIKVSKDSGDDYGTEALLVKQIKDYVSMTVSDVKVSTSAPYNTNGTTNIAAKYLLGEADGSSMSIVFDKMVLDSRIAVSGNSLYNPSATSGASYLLNQAYHTYSSIFSDATFLKSLHYLSGTGSSAKYNYTWTEDWENNQHKVTYADEISETLENLDDDNNSMQSHYVDQEDGYFTSPETNNSGSAYTFSPSYFRSHVAIPYDATENYHEVAVNIVSSDIEKGCGTYNDPYIVDGTTLAVVAKGLESAEGFSDGFKLYIDNDYTGSNIDFSKECANKTGHTQYEFNGSKFVEVTEETSKKELNVSQVQQYLAGAYYYIEESTPLSSKYVGLGGNTAETAFRGVIVGADDVVITNASDKPLINVSNGAVVKNLTINVTNASITKSANTAGNNDAAKFAFGQTATEYYGGVFGKIMGGDNVIDAVQVRFTNNISVTGTYFQNVPVGGYIGVVVNGSVFFRNMSGINTTNTAIGTIQGMNYHVKNNGTGNDIQGEVTITQSTGKETFTSLYVNPIIGRVINGFAINETGTSTSAGTYRYSEDGKYVDYSSSGSGNSLVEYRTRGTSSDLVSLKNNRKNFSIPDFNNKSRLNVNGTTITADDAQELYILSLICQTNMGSASTADGGYTTSQDSGYDSTASGKLLYRATHLANYDGVGKLTTEYVADPGDEPAEPGAEPVFQEEGYTEETEEEFNIRHASWETVKSTHDAWVEADAGHTAWLSALSEWNTAYNSDFTKTAGEKINSANEVPYLIYAYTDMVSSKYPARTITNSNNKFDLNLNSNATTYHLPDSFRGIGFIPSSDVSLTVKNLNGNGNTIDVNIYFRAYAAGSDNYYTAAPTGIALFNTLKTNGVSATNGIPNSNSTVIGDFTLTGYISGKRTSGGRTATQMATDTGCFDINVGGLAPVSSSNSNFANISFDNLSIDSSYRAGALFASSSYTIIANNCNANQLKVTGYRELGGLIGYANGNIYVNTSTNSSSQFILNVHQLNAGNNACYTGGLVGELIGSKHLITQNTDIIGWNGDFNPQSSTKPYIGRNSNANEAINSGTLYVGGVVGYLEDKKSQQLIFDNVNIYGVNIYGYFVGGFIGYDGDNAVKYSMTNCGLHGKSDGIITIPQDTYEIKANIGAGGMVGRCYNEMNSNNTITVDGNTYYNQFNGCKVNNYTIQSVNTDNNNGAGAGGIIGVSRNNKSVRNTAVMDCVIKCNGSNSNSGMGGIVGCLTKHTYKGYNIKLENITFDVNAYVSKTTYSIASYGLVLGRKNANDEKRIQIAGLTVLGNNKITVAYGTQIPTGERDIEFICGRPSDTNVNYFYSNVVNSNVGYTNNSYIIYADYEGASDKITTSENSTVGYYGKMLSTVNGTNNAASVSSTDNFPYVNSSPSVTLGDKTLTGDGIWVSKTGNNINLKADAIINDYNTNLPATGTKTYKAKTYANITSSDIALYNALKTKISTYNTEAGEILPSDIPVIVMDNPNGFTVDDTTYNWNDAIYAYIRILTNSTESFATSNDIYAIDIKKCTYANNTLTVSDNTTLDRNSLGVIKMTGDNYDSDVSGQFTLLDVQFKNPAVTSEIAYHLYIPVYTRKVFNFKFDVTALSGTSYYPQSYTGGSHFSNLDTLRNNDDTNTVVENYGSPVTLYMRYEYNMDDIISDILGGGYGLNWNYNKALDFIYNYSNDNALPSGTSFVLVDVNKNDKVNYSGGFTASPNADLLIIGTTFPAYTVGAVSGEGGVEYDAFSVVTFAELMQAQGITLTATPISAAQAATSMVPVFHAETENPEDASQFSASGVTGKMLTPASAEEISAGTELYTVSAGTDVTINEDYYLTFYVPGDEGDVMHQFTVTSQKTLSSGERITANCSSNDSEFLVFADLFNKDIDVKTFAKNNTAQLMGGEGSDRIVVQTISTISFNLTGSQLSEIVTLLNNRAIPIYHSALLHLVKQEADKSTTVAVDGTSFVLKNASSVGTDSSNYALNSGVYIMMTAAYDGGENCYYSYDAGNNKTGYYRQMVACNPVDNSVPGDVADLTGNRVTNFYEVKNTNNGNAIDLRPYITGYALDNNVSSTARTVKVVANYDMIFTETGIDDQFPEREGNSTAGTIVNAEASLAYSQEGTTYSDNKSSLEADELQIKYYRAASSRTKLYYNVVSDDVLSETNALVRTNDTLGVNKFDDDTFTTSAINTYGEYSATQLVGASDKTRIKWTLSLYRRQPVETAGVPGAEYGDSLPINEYLENIRVYGVGENGDKDTSTVISLDSSSTSKLLTYIDSRGKFEDMSRRADLSDPDEKTNIFLVYIDYDVKTDSALENLALDHFYSNYKVVLTGELVGDTSSVDSDYVIYTNARLDPTFVDPD